MSQDFNNFLLQPNPRSSSSGIENVNFLMPNEEQNNIEPARNNNLRTVINSQLIIGSRQLQNRNLLQGNLRDNYLQLPGITQQYNLQGDAIANNQIPNPSIRWIASSNFYSGAMAVANLFAQNVQLKRNFSEEQMRNLIFNNGVVEYFQFLEIEIQKSMTNISRNLFENGEIRLQSYQYVMDFLNRPRNSINNDLRQLFYHYYRGNQLRPTNPDRWNSDLKSIIFEVINLIKLTFRENPEQSNFLKLLPLLRNGNQRRWIRNIEGDNSYLSLLFAISMIRFPSGNVEQPNQMTAFLFNFPIKYENRTERKSLRCSKTSLENQKLFYFIPEHERVIGIWQDYSYVRRSTEGVRNRFYWNYNVNLLRTCLVKVPLTLRILNDGGHLDFQNLFSDENNLYKKIRKENPFNLPNDSRVRLYTSLTIYVDQNQSLLHIPWILEGSLENGIEYDFTNFQNEFIRVLNNTNSGQNIGGRVTNDDSSGRILYFYFMFLRDPSLSPSQNQNDGEEEKDDLYPPIFRRARSQQIARKDSPLQSTSGMLVGAPYAGTKKEKHYLLGSLINRFTSSNALFKTPIRDLNTCLLMSLCKAQLYCFDFEGIKCVKITNTGSSFPAYKCDNEYVQSIFQFPPDANLPFIEYLDGKCYIKLFEPMKYKNGNRWLEGSKSQEEDDYWEMAAEEILFHLENTFERQIDYRNISDMGQMFANYFDVCISIYDIEMRCNRVHVITPYSLKPSDLIEKHKCIKMIHIVFDQGHIHAISNLQSFVRNEGRKSNLHIYNYCPFCDYKQSRDLCKSLENSLKHISDCYVKTDSFMTGFKREEKKQASTQGKQIGLMWKKNAKGKSFPVHQCLQCGKEITQHGYMSHVCIVPKKPNVPLEENKIYVYDLECAQFIDTNGLYKHECNCLFIYQVYGDENHNGRYFQNEIDFVEALLTEEEFLNSTFIAHNGGSYDIHFLLRILERQEITHTYVPSPTSKHKFIQIELVEQKIRFIDFMRFIPGSLKGIAEAFAIPVGKGDFPHHFNNGKNDEYVGRIPSLYHEEDYWGLENFRSQKEKETFLKWYESQEQIFCVCEGVCICLKQKWSFQEEIKKYCLQDVKVLAEIVKKYRYECMHFENDGMDGNEVSEVAWKAPCLDPLQFMTLPQITMQTLIHGFQPNRFSKYSFEGVTTFYQNRRGGQCWESLLWLINLQKTHNGKIFHRGNSLKEYYHFETNSSFDGYCFETDTAFLFLECSYWGCPSCMREHHEKNLVIPERGLYAKEVRNAYEAWMYELQGCFREIKQIWQCQFTEAVFADRYLVECCQLLKPEQCFYGGRTEVFQLYANADRLQEEIHYYDVTSLYPSVYAHHTLPVGVPIHLMGFEIDQSRFHPTSSNRYFGYARVKVVPRKNDLLGLLPQRCPQTGRLSFPVHPMTGCWGTEEIYLAMQNGYQIEEIYELYYWEENERSDQHLRGYVDYFLRMKQEAEGWIKLGASIETPSEEEQIQIVNNLFIQNGNLGRIRPQKVKKNPVLRSLAKLYLNALWGKFAQKTSKTQHSTVYGTQQFLELWHDRTIEKESCMFREISQGVYKVTYKLKEEYVPPVRHGNLFIAAKVTETARCVLHKQMLRIGPERIIYCDTDSIIFLYSESLGQLVGIGLGQWTNEYPTKRIIQVYALAPKLYSLMLENNDTIIESFRAKGIQMTLENQKRIAFENVKKLIEQIMTGKNDNYNLNVKNFTIFTNSGNSALPYGQVYSRYNEKNVRAIITKRIFRIIENIDWNTITQIRTYPIGFEFN
jgi:hypothetical protein